MYCHQQQQRIRLAGCIYTGFYLMLFVAPSQQLQHQAAVVTPATIASD
jgi:hypothetical protein